MSNEKAAARGVVRALGVCAVLALAGSEARAQVIKAHVGRHVSSRVSTGWFAVPGASIGFTPQATTDVWVVLLSARLRSTSTAQVAAEIRFLVNGTVRGTGGIQNAAADKGASWQHFYAITGTTARQDIQVEIRDAVGAGSDTTVEDLNLVAFRLPAGADFHYAEDNTLVSVPGTTWSNYLSLNVSPSSPGTYLVLAVATTTESPSTSGVQLRLEDPFGGLWPIDDTGTGRHFLNDRASLWTFFVARSVVLAPGANTFTIQGNSAGATGGQIQYQRILAFRTDVLDAFETVEDTADTTTSSTTPVVKSALTTAAPPAARDYVVIQSLYLHAAASTTDERRAGFEHDNVVESSYAHVFDNASQRVPYAHFDAVTTAAAVLYENTFSSSSGAYPVSAKESVIHVLRFATADPARAAGLATFGAKEPASGGPGWGDFNGDGCLDVLVGTVDPVIGSTLYLQDTSGSTCLGTFTEVTDCLAPGLRTPNGPRHSIWGDVNNDGLLDFARNGSPSIEIYLNNGPGTTTGPGCGAGVAWSQFGSAGSPSQILDITSVPDYADFNSEALGWIDYDGDRDLDLVSNNHDQGIVLFRNDGTGALTEVLVPGLPTTGTTSGDYGAVTDIDADGDVDLAQRIETGVDLYLNNGNGTFSAGTFDEVADNANKGGIAFCDFDNDGDFDLFWTEAGTNQIWEQSGLRTGTFVARGVPAGIASQVDGVACADFDNDGDVDLALTTTVEDQLFRNDGGWSFTDVTPALFGTNAGHGASFADYDRDGDADLLINETGGLVLWRNATNDANYLVVRALQDVDGTPGGTTRDAIGATIELVDCAGNTVAGIREVQGGHGHGDQGPAYVHIGLPSSGTPSGPNGEYGVRVTFPDGSVVAKAVVPSSLGAYHLLTITSTDANDTSACTTAVDLASFTAAPTERGILLEWATGGETDNLGFDLYRGLAEDGPYERITPTPIPGLGTSPTGTRYRYEDTDVVAGIVYFYRVEDIDADGVRTSHGPVSARAASVSGEAAASDEPEQTTGDAPRVVLGTPETNDLDVRGGGGRRIDLRLRTDGLVATLGPDGGARIEARGLDGLGEDGLPVRHVWVDVPPCGSPRIDLVRARGRRRLAGLRHAEGGFAVWATREGAVHLARTHVSRRRGVDRARGGGPRARILAVGFQAERRRALVELAPFSREPETDTLVLDARLDVRVVVDREGCAAARRARRRDRPRRGQRFFLAVRERGLQAVDARAVLPGGRPVPVDRLRLDYQGTPVAFHVEPPASVLRPGMTLFFWSEGPALNPYGTDAVYELSLGVGGPTMPVATAAPTGPPVPFLARRLLLEEDRLYQPTLLDAPDRWFWDAVFAPATARFPFTLGGVAAEAPSRIAVRLHGASDTPAAEDHHVRVLVNGTLVAERLWDGRRGATLEATVPGGVLRAGANELALENVGDTGATTSVVLLDRVELVVAAIPSRDDDLAEGTASRSGSLALPFAPVATLDVTRPDRPQWLVGAGGALGVRAGRAYAVVGPTAVRRPAVRRAPRSVLAKGGADYVVVGPASFLPAAAPLLRARARQGLGVRAVAVETIRDEYGHGEARPEAIRTFLRDAAERWRPAPRYVLLLGDGTYDFENVLGAGAPNHVPPLLVRTSFLWTASDPTYAAVLGDDPLPDLAIGRLPAATADDVRVLVEKILRYEAAPALDGARTVLVADDADGAGDFPADAEALAATILAGRAPETIRLDRLGPVETRRRILAAFDAGAGLLSYLGHGGIHLWADENIFDTSAVDALAPQPAQPIVLTMNCLNGYFHFPYFPALAEALVAAPDRGAIAALAPSGLSLHGPARDLHRILLEELLAPEHARLGDALLAAQVRYAASGSLPELVAIYHLFGDPALRIR